jgi:hypothetical protein
MSLASIKVLLEGEVMTTIEDYCNGKGWKHGNL